MTVFLKVHPAALGVGQDAVLQDLQQDVENIRMGLFDLVEQQHRNRACGAPSRSAGRPPHSPHSREASRPDGKRCAFPYTPTYPGGSWRFRRRTWPRPAPCTARSCPRRSGPRKMKEPMGRLGSFSPTRPRRMARATARHRLVLSHDPLVQDLLQLQQPLRLPPRSAARPGCRSSWRRFRRYLSGCRPRRCMPAFFSCHCVLALFQLVASAPSPRPAAWRPAQSPAR